jgi:hypothetical protein
MRDLLKDAFYSETTAAEARPVLTAETFHKIVDDFYKPPVVELTPILSKALDDAMAHWIAQGTPREDIEEIMLIIPWEVNAKQDLETPHGPLHIHFSKFATSTTFLPYLKPKWLREPIKYEPLTY